MGRRVAVSSRLPIGGEVKSKDGQSSKGDAEGRAQRVKVAHAPRQDSQ